MAADPTSITPPPGPGVTDTSGTVPIDPAQVRTDITAAGNLNGPLSYDSLGPTLRPYVEQSLGYYDYFHGYEPGATEDERRQQFNAALQAFTADNKLNNLNAFKQFLLLLVGFLERHGVDVSGIQGILGDNAPEILARDPSHGWQRSPAPAEGTPARLPQQVEVGSLGTTNVVPPPSTTDKTGRYRLATVYTGKEGGTVTTEMVVLNPQGQVVWRSAMGSGSGSKDSLPGLTTTFDGRPITTEYRLDWNDVRLNRNDSLGTGGMSFSNGSPGFSFSLINPSNMGELNAAGRGDFRIHPGGRNVGTAGCLEFLDRNGRISAESDANARSFADLMTSLPASQRPLSLEILNPNMLQRERGQLQAPPVQHAENALPPTTPVKPTKVAAVTPPARHPVTDHHAGDLGTLTASISSTAASLTHKGLALVGLA